MASINKVILLGNLGADPELRYTTSNMPVTTLRIATNEWRTIDGQQQTQTEWHKVVVWGKQAENCSKYLSKGRTVFVEGRLQTRMWEDKEGNKRYTTEIIAQNIQFISGSKSENTQEGLAGFNGNDIKSSANDINTDISGGLDNTPSLDDIPF